MNILEILIQLRDDLKTWVTNNLNALNKKIDEKTIPIDSELSTTSTNPVQNKVINAEIGSLNNLIGDTSVATQISTAIANQNLFSGDYNDLQNAPNISNDGSSSLKVSDEYSNIIVQIDADGLKTTKVTANNVNINGTDISDNGFGKVELADENGNVIVRVDNDGIETTTITANNININGTNILENASGKMELIDENGNVIVKVDNNGIHTTEIEVNDIKIGETLSNHINDNNIHVTLDDKNTWNSKSNFSGNYNDLENAPSITEDDTSNLTVADENGNIIFKANVSGIHSTALTLNGEDISGKINSLEALVGDKSVADQISDAVDGFESFSGDYNDLTNAPNINNNDDKELFVADNAGNIIFRINENGTHVKSLSIGGSDVEGLIDAKIQAAIGVAMSTYY